MPRNSSALCRLLLLAIVVANGAAFAAPLKMLGFDDMSCRAWTQSKTDSEQRKQFVVWIRGLLTGHNYARQNQQVSSVSSATIENFVDRYCVEKPLGSFGDAALRMSDSYSGRNEAISK